MTGKTLTESDHLPVKQSAKLHNSPVARKEVRSTPTMQNNSHTFVEAAKTYYRTNHLRCLRKIKEAQNQAQLEQAYDSYKQMILSFWEQTKKSQKVQEPLETHPRIHGETKEKVVPSRTRTRHRCSPEYPQNMDKKLESLVIQNKWIHEEQLVKDLRTDDKRNCRDQYDTSGTNKTKMGHEASTPWNENSSHGTWKHQQTKDGHQELHRFK